MPIRATVQERWTATIAVKQLQRGSHPTEQSTPGFISALSTQRLSSRPVVTQPTSSRARTDTASLASSGKAEKGSTLPLPTLSSFTVAEPAGDKPVTRGKPKQELFKETEDDGLQELGSGSILTVMAVKDESPVPTVGDEMAQYQPPAQTVISKVLDLETTPDSQTLKPRPPLLTTANKTSTTPQTKIRITVSPVVTQATPQTDVLTGEKLNILELMLCENKVQLNLALTPVNMSFQYFLGELTANVPSTARVTPKQGSAAVTLPQPTATSTGSVKKQSEVAGQTLTTQSSHLKTTTQQVTTTSITTTQRGIRTSSKITDQPNKTAQLGRNRANTTLQSSRTGKKWVVL